MIDVYNTNFFLYNRSVSDKIKSTWNFAHFYAYNSTNGAHSINVIKKPVDVFEDNFFNIEIIFTNFGYL